MGLAVHPPEPATIWRGSPACPAPGLGQDAGRTGWDLGAFDPDRPVLERLHAVATALPDHPAVIDEAGRLTFRELWQVAVRLGLAARRASPREAPLCILLPENRYYPAALFAGLMAGRAIVPLDRQTPASRIADILRDSCASAAVLCAADLPAMDLPHGVAPIVLETVLADMTATPSSPIAPLSMDAPASILYTSGSTGSPKGIAGSERGWAQNMWVQSRGAGWRSGDVGLRLGPTGTAWGLNMNGGLLLHGATVAIVDIARQGIQATLRLIGELGVTVLHAGPSLVKALLRAPDGGAALAGLRLVGLGGEPLLLADVADIRAGLPRDCVVFNLLAATETYIAQWALTARQGYDPIRSASGFICPGYEVAILGENGHPVAANGVGELVVRSRYVALGDWRDGKLDPTRFPADPTDPSRRIYRTGDEARLADDGMVTLLGRRDRMLKINGRRVEPAEIEAALRAGDDVMDCMVLPHRFGARTSLVAFVLPRAGRPPQDLPERLREMLRATMPGYLVPGRIELRAHFPLLPGGKIDARALLASLTAPAAPRPEDDAAEPRAASDIAAQIARVWRVALGRHAPTDRGFGAAGGDSLQLLEFVFRLEKLLGASLPLEAFTMDGTIGDFAAIAEGRLPPGPSKAQGSRTTLLMLPGLSGVGPRLAAFRAACQPDLDIMFLRWGTWHGYVSPGFDMVKLLDKLMAQINAGVPDGRVWLAGYSIGGTVAHALARRLTDAGREVAFLGLFDSRARLRPAGPAEPAEPARASRPSNFSRSFRPPKQGSTALQNVSRSVAGLLCSPWGRGLLRAAAGSRLPVPHSGLAFYLQRRLNRTLLEALLLEGVARPGFLAPLANTPTVLFRTEQQRPGATANQGWEEFCPELTVIPVGGNHVTLFDAPQGRDLVERLTTMVRAISKRDQAEQI